MSFKFPNFSGISFFDDLFTQRPTSDDPDVKVLSLRVRNVIDSMLRYLGHTTLTIGYLNNTKFDIKDTGAYVITVNSHFANGPNAIYCISRSLTSEPGTVKELVSSNGKNNECFELQWNPYEYPLLRINLKLGDHTKNQCLDFFVKISKGF
jgi:hypothetical protein